MLQIISGTSDLKTVVFLHGYLLSSEQWSKLALHRAPWRSVLIDLPYHGRHKAEELKERSLEAYADFVLGEMNNTGIENYALVGHSMGGYIGLIMLQKDPKLKQLILMHSNIWEDSPERKSNRDRVAEVVRRNKSLFLKEALPLLFKDKIRHQAQIDGLVKTASEMPTAGIIHGAISMRDRKEANEIVRNNKKRCFFIQGSHDKLVSRQEAKLVWNQVAKPNHYFEISNCGHMSFIERPRVLHGVLNEIINTPLDEKMSKRNVAVKNKVFKAL